MNTITLWLLMSMPHHIGWQGGAAPPTVVERFGSKEECERVARWLRENAASKTYAPTVGCIDAKVYKP